MGTIEYYYKNVPEKYLVRTEKHIQQITNHLNENFGKEWGGFDETYVDKTKDDRLIVQDNEGNVLFHIRIFNKDHSGLKCNGVGGAFRSKKGNSNCVRELFQFIINEKNTDSSFIFGFCRKSIAEHFIKNITLKGSYIDYDGDFMLCYLAQDDFVMTEDILEGLKKFDLF